MLTVVSLALLAALFGLSILAQLNGAATRAVKRYDVFSLLPRWTFFARPGSFDNHLMYRDLLPDDSFTSWREILPPEKRTLGKALWNPDQRCRKALADAIDLLVQLRKKDPQQPVDLMMPYQALLGYVASQPHDPQATATQFRILRTSGFLTDDKPRLVFRSDWNTIAR